MIFIVAIIGLIFLIFGTFIIKKLNLKDSTKGTIIIFITIIICLVCVAGIIFLLFKSRNINSKENTIRKDWIMKFELVDEEWHGNNIYIYKDNTMIVEYSLHPNKVEKIDSNIDLDEVYEYIENSDYTSDIDYKVVLNSGKNKLTKYISSDFEEIKDFIELIDEEEDIMNQPKGF